MRQQGQVQKGLIEELRQEIGEEISRMRKDRADTILMQMQLKERIVEINEGLDRNFEEIKEILKWNSKVKEILQLSVTIESQDEQDKHSISLVGQKESFRDPGLDRTTQSSLGDTMHSTRRPVLSLDNKCVNCQNNPSSSDRQIILQQFKMACL